MKIKLYLVALVAVFICSLIYNIHPSWAAIPAPTPSQAKAVIHAAAPTIHVSACQQGPIVTVCEGTQSLCVFHGSRCIPASPVKYVFHLRWRGRRIVFRVAWSAVV